MNFNTIIFLGFIFSTTLNAFAQQKEIRYLSGTDNNHTVDWDFFCTGGRNSGYWTKIAVPSHWEQQGFGSYNYGRDYKTYGKNARFADEKALYKYSFVVPSAWRNKKIFIVFEGSMTDTELKINGKSAGEVHQGAFYRFKYDITNKLSFGTTNILEASVSKMSADASVNNAERLADYWILGGIFRPVYLEAVPKEYIDYVAIDAKADGSFAMQAFVKGINANRKVLANIVDAKGKIVATVSSAVNSNDSLVELRTKISNALRWTSESPNLYKVIVSLKNGTSTVYETTENERRDSTEDPHASWSLHVHRHPVP